MKRFILPVLLFCVQVANANIIVVTVQDFQFTPNNFTANVGDVIRWTWISGFHTTTSTTVPPGATTWDSPMNSGSTQYDYTVTVQGTYTYRCIPHAAFGMTAMFTVNAIVPVKLASFSVKESGKGKVLLDWQTLTEENADYFSIQRSENGKEFHELGRVKAAGNSVLSLNYNFIDASIDQTSRYYYYQLLTVDQDKKQERSKIVLFRQDVKNSTIIVKLSPNPVQSGDHLQLWFNADEQTKLHAAMYDVSGKLVYQVDMLGYTGVNFGHLHIHDLSAGIYVLKLTIGKLKEAVKVTVQ